jgi:hypothetical protein
MCEEGHWALRAFTGETGGISIKEFAPNATICSPMIRKHAMRAEDYQNRLYASTIALSYSRPWKALSSWLNSNMRFLTELVFRHGYSADVRGYADFIYYGCENRFIPVAKLAEKSADFRVGPSSRGYYAGSTILMPWGFLQVHRPGKDHGPYLMQFHHNYDQIAALM